MSCKPVTPRITLLGFILLLMLAVVSAGSLFWATPFGLGQTPDAVAYLKGAQGLLNGYGTAYISHQWPPLYPFCIAAISALLGVDALAGARALQSLLYASNLVLLVVVLERFFFIPRLIAALFGCLLIVQPVMTHIHFYAWSEPLYIFFVLLDWVLLKEFVSGKREYKFSWAIGFVAALAFMTRYVGIVLVLINCVVLVTHLRKNLTKLFVHLLIQLVIPLVLYLPWFKHRAITDGAAVERDIVFNLIPFGVLSKALSTFATWLTPALGIQYAPVLTNFSIGLGFLVVAAPVIVFLGIRWLRSPLMDNKISVDGVTALTCFFYCYISFVLSAWIFVDNKVHLDNRLWAPLFVVIATLLLGVLLNTQSKLIRWPLILATLAFLLSAYPSLRATVLLSRYAGLEMSSREHSSRDINRYVSGCDKNLMVYADRPWNFDLNFFTKVYWLPVKSLYYKGTPNTKFDAQWNNMLQEADLIVIEGPHEPSLDEGGAAKEWRLLYSSGDGRIWGRNKTTCTSSRL